MKKFMEQFPMKQYSICFGIFVFISNVLMLVFTASQGYGLPQLHKIGYVSGVLTGIFHMLFPLLEEKIILTTNRGVQTISKGFDYAFFQLFAIISVMFNLFFLLVLK